MPRFLYNRRTQLRTAERAKRAEKTRIHVKKFVDPFPNVHGTLPEKMVYAELSRRGIPFYFLNDLHFNIPEIDFDKSYQADFVLPTLNLIIEVQGAYWHSMEKTIEADAFKFAIYQVAGYQTLAWWDYDILERLQQLIAATPVLVAASKFSDPIGSGELTPLVRTKVDTSKGIRTLNHKRAARMAYKRAAVRQKYNKR